MNNQQEKIKLHIPAGNLDCLREAVNQGADVVYLGLAGPTNLRNFAGINFSAADAAAGVEYAHRYGKTVLITVNSFPQSPQLPHCYAAIDLAQDISADGVILADLDLLDYTCCKYPNLKVYVSVQAGACHAEAIKFYEQEFGIEWIILPRVLSLPEIKAIASQTKVKIEVFAFGSLCINFEGRCSLSSYITGESTNTVGTCSTPRYLTFEHNGCLTAKMCGKAIGKYEYAELKNDPHFTNGMPQEEISQWGNHFMINRRQICKGQYVNRELNRTNYALNDLVYLDTLPVLPRLIDAGVAALKVEGRQRNLEYVGLITRLFRELIDFYYQYPDSYMSAISQQGNFCHSLFPQITPSLACYQGK